MHKFKTIFTLSLIGLAGSMAAQVSMLPAVGTAKLHAAASSENASRLILEEDFSLFTAGSEDAPDETNIADKRTGLVDIQYTHTPYWSGAAIYQAGGTCAITTGLYYSENGSYEDTGFLRTPLGDYAGDLSVSFRARLLDSQEESDALAVILNSTEGRLEAATVEVTPQWKDYTLNFSEGLFEGCLLEFSMLKEKVLLDDIRVTSVKTSIPAPKATAATGFKPDGFTANWNASAEADSYLLTVYKRDAAAATHFIDFEETTLPQGWNFAFDVSGSVSADKGFENSRGIVFKNTGNGFETPDFEQPIRDFSLYLRYLLGKPCFSYISFAAKVGETWYALGRIDIERISSTGEIVTLSSKLPEGTTQIQMLFNKNEANDADKDLSIVVDHIVLMTEPVSEPVITDRAVTATSSAVSGLDPYMDYSYAVKAVNSKFTSRMSNEVMAAGLAEPELLPAADIADDSYTARWNTIPKAEGYIVTNYRVYTVPEDGEVTMLFEDFSKVTQGTLAKPVGLYNSFNPKSLDQYTTTPGWYGLCNYLVAGMMGTRSYFTAQGSIQTPVMNLSAAGGKFKVYMTIVADSDAPGDSLVVQAGPKVFQRQLIPTHSEPIDYVFEFDCGTEAMPLLIYSYGGMPFYIDEIKVTQELPKGYQTFTETESKTVDDAKATSQGFSGLAAGDNESFAYRVFAYRDFYGDRVYSVSSAAMHVVEQAGLKEVLAESALSVRAEGLTLRITAGAPTSVSVYTANGVKLADVKAAQGETVIDLPAPGIYLVSSATGSAVKILAK